MSQTIVGLFHDFATANKVVQQLTSAGITRENITVTSHESGTQAHGGEGIGTTISNLFTSLFGSDANEEAGYYSEAVRRGNALVTVTAEDNKIENAANILNRNNVIDIDQLATRYRASGFTGYDSSAPPYTSEQITTERETHRSGTEGEMAIPVIEEELRVGKRAVQRGGVRVYNRVTERPVEETVTLREEHVNVERRPVNRAVSDADLNNVRDGVVEVTTMAEEAVVAKQARVVEEVVVNKETITHNETVSDTVRRTDVEVEEIDTLDTDRSRGKSAS